ncbi:chemokine-like receptor 1 isoform X2 [Xenopus tropicalis]|uniref:Chemokine-like receptor 1 n=2 Tax=Xenopus tropicalis TaxID=8364 RepID=A0A803JPE6_XENTR|nr:chemokine-like receptor 1 isoform X1 [Xenopus tropicalis]XP_031750665.1 chemokine-like receptor 1 isoform X2 [Xenopus tropicalis]
MYVQIMEVMEVPEEVCNYRPYSAGVLEAARYTSFALTALSCVLGLGGNAVVIAVTGFIMKRKNSKIWFLHLAVADFTFCLLLGLYAHYVLTENWQFGSYLCKISNYVSTCNMYASVFIITALSIDRVLSVAAPIWHRKFFSVRICCWTCAAIWIVTALLSLPVLLLSDEIQYGDKMQCRIVIVKPSSATHNIHKREANDSLESGITGLYRDSEGSGSGAINKDNFERVVNGSKDNLNLTYVETEPILGFSNPMPEPMLEIKVYTLPIFMLKSEDIINVTNISTYNQNITVRTLCTVNLREIRDTAFATGCIVIPCLVLGYLIPLAVILVSNLIIAQRGGKSQSVKSPRLYRIIIMVILFFFLTWTPLITVQVILLAALYGEDAILMYKMYWVLPLVSSIAFSNSCINPIIYVLVGTQARKALTDFMSTILSFLSGTQSNG